MGAFASVSAKWRSLRPRTKQFVVVGGVFALWLLLKGGRMVQVFGQAFNPDGRHAPWSGMLVGLGSEPCGAVGCVLCSITMSFNALSGDPTAMMTPDVCNDLLKQHPEAWAGKSSVMNSSPAIVALGLTDGGRTSAPNPGDAATLASALDDAISQGGVALLRVFHGDNAVDGDHTVLVTGKSGGTYQAADPALARYVSFTLTSNGLTSNDGTHWGSGVPYRAVNVHAIFS